MNLQREIQLEILNAAGRDHPRPVDLQYFKEMQVRLNRITLASNLQYLREHGLIACEVGVSMDGHITFNAPTITARGLDFLADDGGLSAILGVVTIKIHQDSIRDLLLQKVNALPDVSEPDRATLLHVIRSLPGKSLQTFADQLIALGVKSLPEHAAGLQHWLEHAMAAARAML